jgi:hypothetical protein
VAAPLLMIPGRRTSAVIPSTLPNLGGWWDASDASTFTFSSGTVVSQWRDKSSNARHLSPGVAPSRSATVNGLAAVAFDGIDDYLMHVAGSNIFNGTTATFFLVANVTATNTAPDDRLLAITNGGADWSDAGCAQIFTNDSPARFPVTWRFNAYRSSVASGTAAMGAAHVFTSKWTGATNTLYVDGTAQTAVAATETFASNQLLLCAGAADLNEGYGPSQATVCELVWYTDAKNDTDRTAIRSYLSAKWGTP